MRNLLFGAENSEKCSKLRLGTSSVRYRGCLFRNFFIHLAPIHYIQTLGQDILHGIQNDAVATIDWGTFVQTCPRGGDIGEVNLPYGMYKKTTP